MRKISPDARRAARGRSFVAEPRHAPPHRFLQLIEPRAFAEFGTTLALLPLLRRLPRGDGHPVLVLPGLIAGDASTQPLRSFLRERGYAAHGWGLGRNLGLRDGLEASMIELVRKLHAQYGRKVSLIGWSLGGVYARDIANRVPELVRSVITLGSPLHGHPKSTNAWRVYELASGQSVDDPALRRPIDRLPPVPTTSVYSRSDGIVAWRCSVEPETPTSENIEVLGSHCGLGVNASVVAAIADRLAQPEGQWRPFERTGWRLFVYPDPKRAEPRWEARARTRFA